MSAHTIEELRKHMETVDRYCPAQAKQISAAIDELEAFRAAKSEHKRTRREIRRLAYRVHLALVWPEVEAGWRQAQENQRKAQTELLRLHRESATAFAKEQTHGLGLTGAELESLAGLLAERDLHALGTNPELASLETMRAAAASNPLVRNAIGAYEKWTANKCKPSGDQNDLTWRMGFAWHWPEVLRGWLTTNAERLAARAALLSAANQEKNPDALAAEAVAEGRLEQAVRELMPSAIKAVRVPPREGLEALGARTSMFALDAALADFIAGLTLNGAREAANDWREKWRADWSQTRTPGEPACWERWADPLRIPRVLARVLWGLKVRPELDRERSEIPILALAVVRDLAESHWAPNRQLVLFEGRAVLRNDVASLTRAFEERNARVEEVEKENTRLIRTLDNIRAAAKL